jgi:long-subunit acyl-CoA synthetase (AMP-forming)
VAELTHQLELSEAKVLVAHEENIAVALASAKQVGLPKQNILLMGDKVIDGVRPYKSVLMQQARRVVVAPLSAKDARTKVCYLCFSSGTTGKT